MLNEKYIQGVCLIVQIHNKLFLCMKLHVRPLKQQEQIFFFFKFK